MFKEKLAKLIEVRKIMALIVCVVFCTMSATGMIQPDVFVPIVTTIFGYYFGQYVNK